MASTVPSGPSEPSSGAPATSVASQAVGDAPDARDAPPTWRSALDAYLADYDSRGAPSATKRAPSGTAPPPPRSLPPDPRPPLGTVDVNLARRASDEVLRRRLNARLTDGLHLASAPASRMPTSSRRALPSPTLRLPPPDDSPNHLPEYTTLPPARIHDDNHTPRTRPRPRPRPFRASWSSSLSSAASPSSSDDDRRASSRSSSQSASSHDTRRGLEDHSHSDADARGEVRARTSSTRMIPSRAATTRSRSRSRSRPRSRPTPDEDALAVAQTIVSPPSPEALEEARVDALLERMGMAMVVPSAGSNRREARDDEPDRGAQPRRASVAPPLPPPAPSTRSTRRRERRRGRRRRPDESEREVSSCSSRAKDGDESEGEVSSCSSTGSGMEAGTEANESANGRSRAPREDGSLARVASTPRRARSRGGRVNDGFHATVESTSASGGGRSRSSTTRSGSRTSSGLRTSASRAATTVASGGCSSRSDSSPRGSASASARSRSVADTYAEALVEEVRAQLTALEGIKARHALPPSPPAPTKRLGPREVSKLAPSTAPAPWPFEETFERWNSRLDDTAIRAATAGGVGATFPDPGVDAAATAGSAGAGVVVGGVWGPEVTPEVALGVVPAGATGAARVRAMYPDLFK